MGIQTSGWDIIGILRLKEFDPANSHPASLDPAKKQDIVTLEWTERQKSRVGLRSR